MISYLIFSDNKEIKVSLRTENPNEMAEIVWAGQDNQIKEISSWLASQYGAFGHLIGDKTTGIDLDVALRNQAKFKYTNLQPDLIKSYKAEVPKNFVT